MNEQKNVEMTENEAISLLYAATHTVTNPGFDSAVKMAITALRYRIPVKPDRPRRYGMGDEYNDFSRHCGRWLCYEPEMPKYKTEMLFCPACGQKIDWSENKYSLEE